MAPRGDRRDRFLRVAKRRTQRVLEHVRLLARCGDKAVYQYSEDDVQKIFGAIDRELQDARAQFSAKEKRKESFSFD
jgi:hypothetical protein